MKDRFVRSAPMLLSLTIFLSIALTGAAQPTRQAGTLILSGQSEEVPLIRINGKSYVDVESLARVAHGSLRFQGSRTVLTLPGEAAVATPASPAPAVKPPQLSSEYLTAEIEALTQLREWRVALVNAVQNNVAVTDGLLSPVRRASESKLQLAIAAATTAPDQSAAGLLRNEFAAMQQMSDQFIATHASATYIAPDSFTNNAQDQKILSCEQALLAMSSTKQFQDAPACH